jgi:hypothetical protein
MKRCFILLMMLIYGVTSSGMSVKLHYCCGELDGITFISKHSNGCAEGHETMTEGCCSDQQLAAKLDGDHKHSQLIIVQKLVEHAAYQLPRFVHPVNISTTDNEVNTSLLLPRTSVPIYLKNSVFRL